MADPDAASGLFNHINNPVGKEPASTQQEASMTSQPDIINHPPHYCDTEYGCECLEFIENVPFAEACAIKYIVRHRHKGKPVEDLKKAQFYVNWLLKRAETQITGGPMLEKKRFVIVRRNGHSELVDLKLNEVVALFLETELSIEQRILDVLNKGFEETLD
jgi:hypothetical protein